MHAMRHIVLHTTKEICNGRNHTMRLWKRVMNFRLLSHYLSVHFMAVIKLLVNLKRDEMSVLRVGDDFHR